MIQNHRYMVKWYSSVTGEHNETFMHEEQATERLDEVKERQYFDGGLVVDTQGSNPDDFIQHHRDYHANRQA